MSVESSKVSAEIPYGVIERDQTGEEAVMGKWVDISSPDYGVAIINNGRNGYDAKDNAIHLSVIRGPWGPDPRADEGEHTFGYSIYPASRGWREGKVQFQALAFNSPLLAMQEPAARQPAGTVGGQEGRLAGRLLLHQDRQRPRGSVRAETDGRLLRYATPSRASVEMEGREGDVTIHFRARSAPRKPLCWKTSAWGRWARERRFNST